MLHFSDRLFANEMRICFVQQFIIIAGCTGVKIKDLFYCVCCENAKTEKEAETKQRQSVRKNARSLRKKNYVIRCETVGRKSTANVFAIQKIIE